MATGDQGVQQAVEVFMTITRAITTIAMKVAIKGLEAAAAAAAVVMAIKGLVEAATAGRRWVRPCHCWQPQM